MIITVKKLIPEESNLLGIKLAGRNIGHISNTNGAAAFITEDIPKDRQAAIEAAIREKLSYLPVGVVRFLPPKPVFERAAASDF